MAIEAATSIKSRAVLLSVLASALVAKGVDEQLAEDVCEALEACSSLRFDPSIDEQHAGALVKRNKRLVKQLLRVRSNGEKEQQGE